MKRESDPAERVAHGQEEAHPFGTEVRRVGPPSRSPRRNTVSTCGASLSPAAASLVDLRAPVPRAFASPGAPAPSLDPALPSSVGRALPAPALAGEPVRGFPRKEGEYWWYLPRTTFRADSRFVAVDMVAMLATTHRSSVLGPRAARRGTNPPHFEEASSRSSTNSCRQTVAARRCHRKRPPVEGKNG